MSGRFAFVLHTHMPYVEGFGTWPFGEEWLWEAAATCYLPLLRVLDRAGGRLTLSLTPVLHDQLSGPGVQDRLTAFLREVRPASHRLDIEEAERAGDDAVARVLHRSAVAYAAAADLSSGVDLAAELRRRATWTSSATHAVLPLVATDAGLRVQLETRRREAVGFWLPECADAPWLDGPLARAGVRVTCVDLTDRFGRGAPEHLRPLRSAAAQGLLRVPIDREVIELVWDERGYPSRGAYRDTHNLTTHRHGAWTVEGDVWDEDRAREQAQADARDFVSRVARRIDGGGLCTCAVDTELFGHWWHEGPWWLDAVVAECDRQGVELVALTPEVAEEHASDGPSPPLGITSWGTPRDLTTWAGRPVAALARTQRHAELRLLDASARGAVGERALRELLALQSSDWAFLITRGTAGPYPRERAEGHLAAFEAALTDPEGADPAVRNLAPGLQPARLLAA